VAVVVAAPCGVETGVVRHPGCFLLEVTNGCYSPGFSEWLCTVGFIFPGLIASIFGVICFGVTVVYNLITVTVVFLLDLIGWSGSLFFLPV
jgi:hypothetical protein